MMTTFAKLLATAVLSLTLSAPVALDDGTGNGGGYGNIAADDGPGSGGGYGNVALDDGDGPGVGGGYIV